MSRKIQPATVSEWRERSAAWLSAANGATLDQVRAPGDAWHIAHKAGFWREANDEGINDGPIQTALESIFPNVKFNDAKRY
jgi:hypothetical protein